MARRCLDACALRAGVYGGRHLGCGLTKRPSTDSAVTCNDVCPGVLGIVHAPGPSVGVPGAEAPAGAARGTTGGDGTVTGAPGRNPRRLMII